ncbi:MAG: universal stress protein [Myxococcales bacterium]|jgi:nucleotide-binding universal stress UspA family protein|nr:universal stress protein [Myxococcales bacterium]MBL0193299.1 universal stress protein [Myxococcales bacterium]HQY62626.1 universal stress protein [Polyangiaceae bacterium]
MTAFKHILVPTDFGETSARAVDIAIELARKFDAELTIFHASWLPPASYSAYAEGLYWPTDEMAREARKELDTTVARVKTLYAKTDGVIGQGEPWQQVLTVANERGADLIVMATHGRTGLSRVFLGSVAEKVVRLSPIPVLTVSGSDAAKERARAHGSDGST